MLESLDPIDPAQDARDAAFTAAPFTWKGLTLQPFAVAREADWIQHCRRIGLADLGEAFTDPFLFLPHALRLLWFCAHDPVAWTGSRDVRALDALMREWIDANVLNDDAGAANTLALAIYDRAHLNQPKPLDDADSADDSGKAPGPSVSRSTSPSSRGPSPECSPSTTSSTTSPRSAAGPTSTPRDSAMAASTSGPQSPPQTRLRSWTDGALDTAPPDVAGLTEAGPQSEPMPQSSPIT